MITYFNLRKGVKFIFEGQPYEVLEFTQMKKAQREGIAQTKIRNLITGKVIERNFHQNETFEEAQLKKIKVDFIYSHRDKFYFCQPDNPSQRIELSKEQIGFGVKFLKPNLILEALKFEGKIISIVLPIKIELRVTEAPPGVRGERAQSGTKTVTLETGAQINAPLFIKEGDVVEINTETEEYVRRVE